tara:strand:+ start:83 stop:247 length:165 start_codon:yes stop_codon:yes gene_type:complete
MIILMFFCIFELSNFFLLLLVSESLLLSDSDDGAAGLDTCLLVFIGVVSRFLSD